VRSSSDRRLELTIGTRPGLAMLFDALAARMPAFALAFGELQCDLRRSDGSLTVWTIDTRSGSAAARRGPAERPALTARLSVANFIRIAAGELDPGRAVLDGRLDFAGDFGVVTRLTSIFRSPQR
jgi:putative sterol carrier protein